MSAEIAASAKMALSTPESHKEPDDQIRQYRHHAKCYGQRVVADVASLGAAQSGRRSGHHFAQPVKRAIHDAFINRLAEYPRPADRKSLCDDRVVDVIVPEAPV